MRLIRDDAPKKLKHALILAGMAKTTSSTVMAKQHIEAVEVIIEICLSSMKEIEEPKGA